MDKFRIDSHKLIYHVKRVNDWLDGKNIYPIYAEIATSGACNHRCTYCALDYMEYKHKFLDKDLLKNRLNEMASLGLKSVMFAGEGEPLLHKDISEIINNTKAAGIDVALTTNGVLLSKDLVDKALENITWIKVSINAAVKETYANIHRTSPEDFEKVIENISYAAKVNDGCGYNCTLGMQLILLPENWEEALQLAKKAKDIGANYLVIKPYSQHPFSKTSIYKDIRYEDFFYLAKELEELNDEKFHVVFRANTMKKWDRQDHDYQRCFALPFWSYIDAEGNVWGCSVYLSDNRFLYGNICESSFKEIWESKARKNSKEMVETEMDTTRCRINCRMDEMNRYLWELKHPPEHVNFI